jgi:hypothetical protein
LSRAHDAQKRTVLQKLEINHSASSLALVSPAVNAGEAL